MLRENVKVKALETQSIFLIYYYLVTEKAELELIGEENFSLNISLLYKPEV